VSYDHFLTFVESVALQDISIEQGAFAVLRRIDGNSIRARTLDLAVIEYERILIRLRLLPGASDIRLFLLIREAVFAHWSNKTYGSLMT
jgi:hypothetical protein